MLYLVQVVVVAGVAGAGAQAVGRINSSKQLLLTSSLMTNPCANEA